jgi:hypothetical protein
MQISSCTHFHHSGEKKRDPVSSAGQASESGNFDQFCASVFTLPSGLEAYGLKAGV